MLAAKGPHFSSGHNLRDRDGRAVFDEHKTVGTWYGFTCAGAAAQMPMEKEVYIGFSGRWRNIPKPTIAEAQGKVIAGGLMLVWPCDLIVASEDTSFADTTPAMGVCGAEFFNHPWEFGVRKAKEMLLTSDEVQCVRRLPPRTVTHVVPRDELTSFTMALAPKIAEKSMFVLKLTKEAVNAAQDNQGRVNAMQTSFALHQPCHSHNMNIHGWPIDPVFMERQFPNKSTV